MALAYTGSILGAEFAVARFLLCLVFGIGIGLLTALLFWRDDASHDAQTDTLFADKASVAPAALGVLLSLVALLIAGTLKLWPLTATVGAADLPLPWAQAWQDTLFRWVPFDEAKGEEGVSVQGSLLILLLVVGVFVVGIVRELIRPEWIQALAGRNDLTANAVAVVFGVFMYFPTLVEVPVARMFLDLGMHPGPLLAYLMAVVKVRASAHSDELRLYSIGEDGIRMGETLPGQEGLLGGRPTRKHSSGLPAPSPSTDSA